MRLTSSFVENAMLVPLTRETFDQVIPPIATGAQYSFVWGKVNDVLQRLLISLLIVVSIWLTGVVFGHGAQGVELICFIIGGMYWLWAPVYVASVRNNRYRRFPYLGFWRGRVLDIFITEELISETQQANQFGELVIVENRERRVNIKVGDRQGFRTIVQAPVKKTYKAIRKGMVAELLLLSKDAELERIDQISDLYLPELDLWVGDYPIARRDIFRDMSDQFAESRPRRRRPSITGSRRGR
jgi:hypothetical protein